MIPLISLDKLLQLLPLLTGGAAPSASAPNSQAQAPTDQRALVAAVIAALAQQPAPAAPVAPAGPMAPAEPPRVPWFIPAIGFLWIIGFLATMAATIVALASVTGPLHDALAVLCLVLGVEAAGSILVLAWAFSSTYGSYAKTAWSRQEGQGAHYLPPVAIPTQPAQKPPVEPAPQPTKPTKPTEPDAGHYLTLRGKMSEFGGPNDKGSGDPTEGLALYDEAAAAKRPDLFLSIGPGLFRRLNPATLYYATRFDYRMFGRTRADQLAWLREHPAKITATKTGKSVMASAVDWGPNVRTGRVADLSPGVLKALGISTDDEVIVEVPLPGAAAPPVSTPPPQPPTHPRILSDAALKAAFGDFSFTEAGGGRVKIDPAWVAANIVDVEIPQLARMGVKTVQFHRRAADSLKAVFADIEAAGLLDKLLTFDGTWVPRHMTWDASRPLSRHSWGIAIDLNASHNGYGSAGAKPGTTGSLWEIAPIFERHGFAWGEEWTSSKDPMHFEYSVTT